MKVIRLSDYTRDSTKFDRWAIDGIHMPKRREPMDFDDGQPDEPGFFHGLLAAITLGGMVGLVVLFVALLTVWRFGL